MRTAPDGDAPFGDDITPAQAMAALEAIRRNAEAGLLPTTGGAISLIGRSDLDALHEASAGKRGAFRPVLPDSDDRPAKTRAEWDVAAIEHALLVGDRPFDVRAVREMDAVLAGYRGHGVDWRRIHSFAAERDASVPAWESPEFWAEGEPRSVLAFCGAATRSAAAAAGAGPAAAGAGSGLVDRVADVEERVRTLRLAAIVAAAVVVGIVVLALLTARHWTKVDVAEQPETFRVEQQATGKWIVRDDGVSPCYKDQDWTDCINLMVNEYNAACVGVSLTRGAERICENHKSEIDRMRAEDEPGWVVETVGDLGQLSRTEETVARKVSNEDARPAVTHEAVCYLWFIGECS